MNSATTLQVPAVWRSTSTYSPARVSGAAKVLTKTSWPYGPSPAVRWHTDEWSSTARVLAMGRLDRCQQRRRQPGSGWSASLCTPRPFGSGSAVGPWNPARPLRSGSGARELLKPADRGNAALAQRARLGGGASRAARSSRCGSTASNLAFNTGSTAPAMAIPHNRPTNLTRSGYVLTQSLTAGRGRQAQESAGGGVL